MISAVTKLYGVIGDPIEHSLSPLMQNWFIEQFRLDAVYTAFHVKHDALRDCIAGLRALGIGGLNVTVPHKEAVLPFANDLSEEVKLLGAANTLKNENGRITAHVTDPYGFLESLGENKTRFNGASVLMYGAGGAAKSVAFALGKLGVAQLLISDVVNQKALDLAILAGQSFGVKKATALHRLPASMKEIFQHTDIVINATAVGMSPMRNSAVVKDYDGVSEIHFFYDLVYNPAETKFLRLAAAQGAVIQNGLDMLIFQGLQSLRIWTGQELPLSQSRLCELQAIFKKKLVSHE